MDDDNSSNGAPMLLVTLHPPSSRGSPRSVSPMMPSPTRDLRGLSLFRAISRRLGRHRRRHNGDLVDEDEEDDDTSQSSSDSDDRSSGSAGGRESRSKKCPGSKKSGFLHRSASCVGSDSGLLHLHGSSGGSSSSSGSDTSSGHVPRHNAASPSSSLHQASSLRKVFQSLTRNSRSHSASCAAATSSANDAKRRVSDDNSTSGGKKKNKSILRAPVAYTYVRGLSGLPTQRVPRGYPCVYLPTNVCCGSPRFGTQHLAGLNR
ncbi:hypothetical protein C0J52_20512 [Blattella germanica]|nr:hypothetical protein C0J52_20512 [Blattella germanica]